MSKAASGSIGRYELQKRLGDGGMGTVFLARDPLIERLVAIKLLHQGIDSENTREEILREARAAGSLRHPNIVTIFDVGESDGEPFIAMEYVQGETLADIIRRHIPLSLSRRLEMVESICWGLQYAHDAGLIHRDIKPANVMIGEDGILKILDFGMARIGPTGLTQGVVGTLNYMAPEQLEGRTIDQRVDVFAVGALLYELVSGRRAFPGNLADGVLAKILTAQPEPLDTIEPSVHPTVVAIVNRCLEKKAHDRYPNCRTLAKTIATVRKEVADSEPASGAVTQPRIGDRDAPWMAAARKSRKPLTPDAIGQSPKGDMQPQAPASQLAFAVTSTTAIVAVLLATLSLWVAMRPPTAVGPATTSFADRTEKSVQSLGTPNAASRVPPVSPSKPVNSESTRSDATPIPTSVERNGLDAVGAQRPAKAPSAAGSLSAAAGSPTGGAASEGSMPPSAPSSLPPAAADQPNPSGDTRTTDGPRARAAPPSPGDLVWFTDPNRRFAIRFPSTWQWAIIGASGGPIVTFVQPNREAAVVIEEFRLQRDLTLQDLNQEFAAAEAARIGETQTNASDLKTKVTAQRIGPVVQVDYRRPGLSSPGQGKDQRVRQFSIPFNGALYRITCLALASRFDVYEATFQRIVESLEPAGSLGR